MKQLSLTTNPCPISVTGPAHPLTLFGDVGVGLIVEMSLRALGLSSMNTGRREWRAPQVLLLGDRLNVRGIHASWSATEVVEAESVRDRPNQSLVSNAMSTTFTKNSIPLTLGRSPQPATRLDGIDLVPESEGEAVYDGVETEKGCALAPPPRTMRVTPTTSARRLRAFWDATLSLHRELILSVAMQPDVHSSRLLLLYASDKR